MRSRQPAARVRRARISSLFFFSSRRRHTRFDCDWSSDVCSSDLGLIAEQASEMDPKKREVVLHRIQQLIHEKSMIAPIWELAFINGHGPRVAESGLTLITSHAYSSPYEDLKLVAK